MKDPADFRNEILTATWADVKQHAVDGAVVVVDPRLDLATVARAAAKDDKRRFERWLADGGLRRPTEVDLAAWSATPDIPVRFAIVRPWVFVIEPRSV